MTANKCARTITSGLIESAIRVKIVVPDGLRDAQVEHVILRQEVIRISTVRVNNVDQIGVVFG